jgi:hypothetical protein
MIAASLTTTMPTVKVLALDYVGPDLDPVLDILRCFTCLESLYISVSIHTTIYLARLKCLSPLDIVLIIFSFYLQLDYISPMYMKNVRKYALPYDPVECLEFHLKKVAFKHYLGNAY